MRLRAIDILRAGAVLLIVAHHLPPYWAMELGPFAPVFARLNLGGWIGVDLFFVLSGYLVSGLLFAEYRKHGSVEPGRFLLRRGFKIYPSFWLLLAATAYLNRAWLDRSRFLADLLFIQNYRPGYWAHTWSLGVEEHFYFTLALLIGALARRRGPNPFRSFPYLVAGVVALTLGARIWTARALPFSLLTHYEPTHLRLDALFMGALLSYWRELGGDPLAKLRPAPAISLGLLSLVPAFLFPRSSTPLLYTGGFLVFSLGACLLLEGALKLPDRALPKALAFLGRHSYSIYLWHIPWLAWGVGTLQRLFGRTFEPAEGALVYLAGSIAGGIVLGYLVESPFLRLRDRLVSPRRAASPRERTADVRSSAA